MASKSILTFDPENRQDDYQVIAKRLDNGKMIIGWIVIEQQWYAPQSQWKYYVFYNKYGSGGFCGGATDLGLEKVLVDPTTIRPFTCIEKIKYDLSNDLIVVLVGRNDNVIATIHSEDEIPYGLWKNGE